MARRASNKDATKQPEVTEINEQATEVTEVGNEQEQAKVADETKVNHFTNIVREGKAKKLSPKTENHVFYEIAIHDEEKQLYIRLKGNEGGGLHSKEWIPIEDIFAVLDVQKDKPFKSTVLKCVFKGGSANNTGFLAAALRGLLLILPSEKSVFLHVLAPDYEQVRDDLRSLLVAEDKQE